MGRLLLISRLVTGDIKRRRTQSALLLMMIVTTTTTLTLGLALQGVTDSPWARTRAATKGPGVVATFLSDPGANSRTLGQFRALSHARGVAGSSGPYPVAFPQLTARGISGPVNAEGRGASSVLIDQPHVTAGRWIRPGDAVIERGLADALDVSVGEQIQLNGRAFHVGGIAVSSARPFYPAATPGLVWLTRAETERLATAKQPLGYELDLKLTDPAAAPAFAAEHSSNQSWFLESWQDIRNSDGRIVAVVQKSLLVGSWLIWMLAIASIAVLGGRPNG